ncbi:MAG: lipoprotein signal peptidase [Bacteroidetes bacterium]|nr:lipoprotein signal peptidase [Bacteroidota bacterium]
MKRPLLIIFAILLADQLLKIWIKTNMYLGQEFEIAPWFIIHFTENNGMAFGLEFGGDYGKLFLSVFRILFVSGLGYYLWKLTKEKASSYYITVIALVFAGAVGNIIDSVFYGMLFSSSDFGTIATLFPPEGGYASVLHGKVVDMFYFPLLSGNFPEWLPIWGGEHFLFFRPVFNIADASITGGVIVWILFQKKIYPEENKTSTDEVKNPTDNSIVENN